MRKFQIIAIFLILAGIAVYFSCSGGTSSMGIGDTVIVHEASSVPTVDISGIDIVSPPSGSVSKDSFVVGDPSSTGCMSTKFYKPTLNDSLKMAELSNCIIKKAQALTPSFFIPLMEGDTANSYGYYKIGMRDSFASVTGIKSLRLRIGNISDGTANTLKIDACQSADGASFKRTNHFEVTGIISTHTWSGSTVAHNIGGTPVAFESASFEIVMNSASDLESAFDWSKASSANFTANRGANPSTEDVTDATTFDDIFNAAFTHTALDASLGVAEQSITSVYDVPAFPQSAIFSMYTATNGASKALYNNGQGSYEDLQAFNPKEVFPTIIDSATVSYFGDVSGQALPSTDLGDSVRQAVAFQNIWDCEAPTDRTFSDVDASAFDMAECESLVTTLEKPDTNTLLECFGGVSQAGDYIRVSGRGVCPLSTISTFTGSGPVYTFTSGTDQISFTFVNDLCVAGSINGSACVKCEVGAVVPDQFILQNCGACLEYTMQK